MARQLRIAVADDEADMRDFLRLGLTRIGHAVVAVAATGLELVDQVLSSRPDVIFTDLLMPELSGVDAVLEIARERPIPVIFVSAALESDAISRLPPNLAFGVLIKPVKYGELQPAIVDLLRRQERLAACRDARTLDNAPVDPRPTAPASRRRTEPLGESSETFSRGSMHGAPLEPNANGDRKKGASDE